jgi:Transposase DDE domain
MGCSSTCRSTERPERRTQCGTRPARTTRWKAPYHAGADKNYDTGSLVAECRELRVAAHVAQYQHSGRRSAIDGRVSSAASYSAISVARRKIESIFGWMKTTGKLRKKRYIGLVKMNMVARMTGLAYNLLRVSKVLGATTQGGILGRRCDLRSGFSPKPRSRPNKSTGADDGQCIAAGGA